MNWGQIYKSQFDQWFDKETFNLFSNELRETIYGWKDANYETINEELCKVLRATAKMEKIPRAGGREGDKYTVRDITKWILHYRHIHPAIDSATPSGRITPYAEATIIAIKHFIDAGDNLRAALVSVTPPAYCGCSALIGTDLSKATEDASGRMPNAREKGEILKWCHDNSFNPASILSE